MELREPIMLVMFEIAKVIWQYGSPLLCEIFSRSYHSLAKNT